MKALSMRQPWAWMVAAGLKTIETRKWSSNYVGPLLIHACGKFDKNAQEDLTTFLTYAPASAHPKSGEPSYTGGIIALVDMTDCWHITGTWKEMEERHRCYFSIPPGESRYGFVLDLVWKFNQPIPCKGALSLWTPPDDIIAQVNERIAR